MPGDWFGANPLATLVDPQPTSLPPSTGMIQPVVAVRLTTAAMTAWATSSAWTTRFSGVVAATRSTIAVVQAGDEGGVHGGGRDGHDADFGTQDAGEREGHGVESGLRTAIGNVAAGADDCRDRRDVHNHRITRFFHQRHKGSDRRERAADVGGEDAVDQVVGEGFEIGMGDHAGETGGVDQDVAAAILVFDDGGGFADQRGFQHRDADGSVAGAGEGFHHRIRLFRLAVVADDDFRAGLSEALGRGRSDCSAAAGDDGDFVFQVHDAWSPRRMIVRVVGRRKSDWVYRGGVIWFERAAGTGRLLEPRMNADER